MTAAEARKKQWEGLKDKPLADKLKYIFTYYWPGILGGVCVLIFLVSWIGGILTQKEIVLSGHIMNGLTAQSYQGDIRQDFMAQQQLDTNKQDFQLTCNSSMLSDAPNEFLAAMESIVTRIAVGDIDFLVGDLETYQKFSAYHADLRNVLTEAQLSKWADYLVYVEKEALDYLTSDDVDKDIILPEYFLSAEGLKNPIPIAVRLPENCRFLQAYRFPVGAVVFGIPHNVQHTDAALAFLEYAMSMTNTPTA